MFYWNTSNELETIYDVYNLWIHKCVQFNLYSNKPSLEDISICILSKIAYMCCGNKALSQISGLKCCGDPEYLKYALPWSER